MAQRLSQQLRHHTPSLTTAPHLTHTSTYRRALSTTPTLAADFTHAVIGGGAVGLAIARRLQSEPSASTLLLERHKHVGTETSSRNSEVIHAGLYYGHDTLKTELCLKGKRMMYELCERYRIPHMNCGKWIVAQSSSQMGELEKVKGFADSVGVPTRWISPDEAEAREPDVRCTAGALESTSTGIVDSHGYMQYLHGSFEEAGGETSLNSSVTAIEALGEKKDGSSGWRIFTNGSTDPADAIMVETIINSAGLAAIPIHNLILKDHPERQRKPYYAKGSYYSYSSSKPKPKTLIYPAPVAGHGGLGTHLTLDMAGRVRFGPDLEWVDDPTDLSVNDKGLEVALDDIQSYLPGLEREKVELDYCGIRPKLGRKSAQMSGKDFIDFYIQKEEGFRGWVNLLGIESPGLTSSLAIGDHVRDLLYQ